MGDGAGLLLTTGRYYTPKGRSIQARGIEPDIVVENLAVATPARKAGDLDIREHDLSNHLPQTAGEKEQPKEPEGQRKLAHGDDYQLMRALDLLKGWERVSFKKPAAGK